MTDPLAPTGLLPDTVTSIADQLRTNAQRRGDQPALVSMEDGRTLSWDALYRVTVRLAHLLRAMGIDANDRIKLSRRVIMEDEARERGEEIPERDTRPPRDNRRGGRPGGGRGGRDRGPRRG